MFPPLDAKVESRLTLRDLEKLHKSFLIKEDGFYNSTSLTKIQFCEAMLLLLKIGTAEEYAELFDQIDVMREGMVDWDSVASHLLLGLYEKDDKVKSTLVPQWKDIKILPSPHKDTVQRVAFLKNINRYIAISKEGCISCWKSDLKPQPSLKAVTDSCKIKDLWVTHFVPLQSINKIALAFTSKEIAIYDLSSSKLELKCQYKIQGLIFTPLCLDYWSDINSADDAMLVWGDVGGYINIIFFNSANIALFERPPSLADEKQELCLNVQLRDVEIGKYKNAYYTKYEAHNERNKQEWVRKVQYSHYNECFISCATTNTDSLVIGWIEKHSNFNLRTEPTRKEIKKKFEFSVSQGIGDFDFSEKLNLIATAGVNSHVCLWNPYVVSKPNGVLKGHMSSVVQVQFITARSQLISFSKDKVFRLWDIHLQVCIQRLVGIFPKGTEVVSSMFFDAGIDRAGVERNRLFITFNYQITVMGMKAEIKDRIVSHEKSVVAALYNSVYNQVVSICQTGTIIMWLIDTGQKVRKFNRVHGNSEITCLAQDQSETRLFTGSIDGTIKVWDFNGHCYNILQCSSGQPADVNQVLALNRGVIAVGWAKHITVFRSSTFKDFYVKPSEWKGRQEHAEDILSCAFLSPSTLATGSYDGKIVIWNTNSEHASCHIGFKSCCSMQCRGGINRTSLTQENELGWAIIRLVFLESRKEWNSCGVADLVSCNSIGCVQFWSTSHFTLAAEFVAHENVGSIIMATDRSNNFIVTADTEGFVKVWEIKEYALSLFEQPITNPPSKKIHFQAHQDQINSLEICERQGQLLIISASSDCSVTLWDINGKKIGIFGQEDHWKIESYLPSEKVKNEAEQKRDKSGKVSLVTEIYEDSLWRPEDTAITEPTKFRINSWNKTVLGKEYQKLRVQKRERKQPGTIQNMPLLYWAKTGDPLPGPYSALQIQELTSIQNIVKPDTTCHFSQSADPEYIKTKLPDLSETALTPFDERSMFPGYVLEYEKRMKNYHTMLINQKQSKDNNETFGLEKLMTHFDHISIPEPGLHNKIFGHEEPILQQTRIKGLKK